MSKRNYFLASILVPALALALALTAPASAQTSLKDAIKTGKKNIQRLMDEAHRYPIEYDTVIALPVHSRTIYKGDFYLLYFLRGPKFQAEVAVDKKTGTATLLTVGKMVQPYHDRPGDLFHYKYFDVDSVFQQALQRNRIKADSARLVYFGVTPLLGKRGVIWEIFSPDGINYLSLAGPIVYRDQILSSMNTHQRGPGNYTADSIRLTELADDIRRLDSLTEASLAPLKLTTVQADSLIQSERDEMETIYTRFPDLRKRVSIESPQADSTKGQP